MKEGSKADKAYDKKKRIKEGSSKDLPSKKRVGKLDTDDVLITPQMRLKNAMAKMAKG